MSTAWSFEPVRWLALPARWIAVALGALGGSAATDADSGEEEAPREPSLAPTPAIAPRLRVIEAPPRPRTPSLPPAGPPAPASTLPREPTGPMALPRTPESVVVSWEPRSPPDDAIDPRDRSDAPALRVRIHPSQGRSGRELLVPLTAGADHAYLVDLPEDAVVDVEVGAMGAQGFAPGSAVASCRTPRRRPHGSETARWRDPSTKRPLSYDVVTAPVSACRIDFERNTPPPAAASVHAPRDRPADPSRS